MINHMMKFIWKMYYLCCFESHQKFENIIFISNIIVIYLIKIDKIVSIFETTRN